jgi:AcrR family transcriptional regulator
MTPTGYSRVSASAPASIWDFPEHGSRGPRARHDRAAIATLAVRIADAEGLDAVTMRRLAGELGIAVMSLYNYVPAKEHLAQLMTDHLAGEYAYPVTPPPDPRAAIADLARQTRDIARRHPWLAGLLHPPMPPGPNGLRYLDYFLGLLAGSRLGPGARLEIITMIRGFATMYGAMQAAPASTSEQATAQDQALTRAAAQGRYPHLAAALAVAGPPRRHDDIFRSGIERLIETARLRLRRRDVLTAATRWPVGGRPVTLRVRGLPHFDQITVGIADIAAGLVLVMFRRRQELSTPGAPFGVHGLDVFNPDIEEAADPVGIARRLQGDRRLVVGRASADIDDDPGVG